MQRTAVVEGTPTKIERMEINRFVVMYVEMGWL